MQIKRKMAPALVALLVHTSGPSAVGEAIDDARVAACARLLREVIATGSAAVEDAVEVCFSGKSWPTAFV